MSKSKNAGAEPKHKLQIHFDTHECELPPDELVNLGDHFDALARQVGNFPHADVRVVIEWNGRNNEYAVKLTLLLPGNTIVTSDHDPLMHAAFRRALDSLELAFESYMGKLEGVAERQQHEEAAKRQPLVEAGSVDQAAVDAAATARDYPAFRTAVAYYEDWLRLRVGRWVERYPDVQARMGRDFDVLDLTEGVFLMAFEQHEHRRPEVRYRDWLDGLIDPTVRAFAHDPVRERENVNMARSACAVQS